MAIARARFDAQLALIGCSMFAVLAGCGGESPTRSIDGYCAAVRTNITALDAPNLATAADITATLDRYESIAATAPAAIEPEWRIVIDALTIAATVVLDDPESLTEINAAALKGQPAYTRIQQYTLTSCAIAIGTPPPPTNPVTATTVAPPATTTG